MTDKETELGIEKQCSKCKEYWPKDEEFFYRKNGYVVSPCKACYDEIYHAARKRKRKRSYEKS